MAGLTISRHQIDIGETGVAIQSTQLTDLLIHRPKDVLDLLALAGGVVSLSDVSVDDSGRIVITHAGFRDGLQRALAAQHAAEVEAAQQIETGRLHINSAGTNTVCGLAC